MLVYSPLLFVGETLQRYLIKCYVITGNSEKVVILAWIRNVRR